MKEIGTIKSNSTVLSTRGGCLSQTLIILLLWSTGCRQVYQQMYVNGVKVGEPTKFVPRDTMYRVFKMYRK